jgi:hypothetical protein
MCSTTPTQFSLRAPLQYSEHFLRVCLSRRGWACFFRWFLSVSRRVGRSRERMLVQPCGYRYQQRAMPQPGRLVPACISLRKACPPKRRTQSKEQTWNVRVTRHTRTPVQSKRFNASATTRKPLRTMNRKRNHAFHLGLTGFVKWMNFFFQSA